MPFDSLPELLLEPAPDYRRLPDGRLDYDHYRHAARQARAQAIWQAMTQGVSLCGAGLAALLRAWLVRRDRVRARHQLLAMDDRALRDIGISRCDAIQGMQRRLWRP